MPNKRIWKSTHSECRLLSFVYSFEFKLWSRVRFIQVRKSSASEPISQDDLNHMISYKYNEKENMLIQERFYVSSYSSTNWHGVIELSLFVVFFFIPYIFTKHNKTHGEAICGLCASEILSFPLLFSCFVVNSVTTTLTAPKTFNHFNSSWIKSWTSSESLNTNVNKSHRNTTHSLRDKDSLIYLFEFRISSIENS